MIDPSVNATCSVMTRKQRKDAITAHHEAGHAVASVMLGMDFDYVTIIPDGDSRGHVENTRPKDILEAMNNGDRRENPLVYHWMENEIIETLAGPEAQHLFFPRSRLNDTYWGVDFSKPHGDKVEPRRNIRIAASGGDLSNAIRLVDDLHGQGNVAECYYFYVTARARALVRTHRDEIERVAQALLKYKTLSANQVRAAMSPEFAKDVA